VASSYKFSYTLSSSHSAMVKLTCDCSANASGLLSIFVSSDVISSTLFHSSPSSPTSYCFCFPHACVHLFYSMLLASVHHPDFMAHDLSASRNLDSELPLRISPAGLFSALDRFNHRYRAHWAGVLIAFYTNRMLNVRPHDCYYTLQIQVLSPQGLYLAFKTIHHRVVFRPTRSLRYVNLTTVVIQPDLVNHGSVVSS